MFILVSSTRLQNAPSGDWKAIRRQQAWLMTPLVIVCFREKISDAHTHTLVKWIITTIDSNQLPNVA